MDIPSSTLKTEMTNGKLHALGRYVCWARNWHGFTFGSAFTTCGIQIPNDMRVRLAGRLTVDSICPKCLPKSHPSLQD